MKIYTKTGDHGETSLANGQRVRKTDDRLEAYGTADELNAFVGLLRCAVAKDDIINEQLVWVQNKLFNLGADLAGASGQWISSDDVQNLENWIDAMQEDLPPFKGFVLPGGSTSVSLCHVCRTIARRLERLMVRADSNNSQPMDNNIICFVNRLSDFLFVLAQKCIKNEELDVKLWKK